ncbi:MAG: hypothetical protein HN590_11130 [Calditrichaeota bacterium]|nr:hypothetical protein [Calditrichota bacterium]
MIKHKKWSVHFRTQFLILLLICLHVLPYHAIANQYVRFNQIGFLPDEQKNAFVLSNESLQDMNFQIINGSDNVIFNGRLQHFWGEYLAFSNYYKADFSSVTTPGRYKLRYGASISQSFKIDSLTFQPIAESLLRFFQTQRCGDTNPQYHKPCHLKDATKVIGGPINGRAIDVSGGWHDAGDYTKFLNTTAYATYLLLLTYEYNREAIPDNDNNGFNDLLDEARIGLDWLMKMHYRSTRLLIQVQNNQDQTVGWRLPEADPLVINRPAYDLPSKALCGIYSATMALASKIYTDLESYKYGFQLLHQARQTYDLAKSAIPESSSGPDTVYYDQSAWDNLGLAAAELYRTTGDSSFFREAQQFLSKNKPTHWISWGDLDGLAHLRLAEYDSESLSKIEQTLNYFKDNSSKNPYGFPLESYTWGSGSIQIGVAMLSLLYKEVTGKNDFQSLAISNRDFILGQNPHGICLIGGFGSLYPKNFHHQISYIKKIPLIGGFAAGYVSYEIFKSSQISLDAPDKYIHLQHLDAVYHDDRNDYLCNEPSISNNATVLFVLSWFATNGI